MSVSGLCTDYIPPSRAEEWTAGTLRNFGDFIECILTTLLFSFTRIYKWKKFNLVMCFQLLLGVQKFIKLHILQQQHNQVYNFFYKQFSDKNEVNL